MVDEDLVQGCLPEFSPSRLGPARDSHLRPGLWHGENFPKGITNTATCANDQTRLFEHHLLATCGSAIAKADDHER